MYTISKYTGIAHTLFLTFPPTYSLLNQTGRASSPLDHSTALTGNTKATASQGTAWVPPHRPTEGSLLLTRFPGLLGSLLPYHIPMQGPCFYPTCWARPLLPQNCQLVGFFPTFRPQFRSLSSEVFPDQSRPVCNMWPYFISCTAKLLLTDSLHSSGSSLRSETHLFSSLLYPREH